MSFPCPVCGRNFERKGRRLFCSNACKQRRYRRVGIRIPFKRRPKYPGASSGDCVPSTIAYVSGRSFAAIKEWLVKLARKKCVRWREGSGFPGSVYEPVLTQLGWKRVPLPSTGLLHDCAFKSFPRVIVVINHHMFAVIDGAAVDSWNAQKKYLKRLKAVYVESKYA